MDRVGASYENTIEMIRDRLGANPIVVQIPIGNEAEFKGVIDLFTERAIIWEDDLGREPREMEIPPDMKPQVAEMRGRMIEEIAEIDDDLTLKFLEGDEISEEELRAALRKGVNTN